jgi:hypothetical protein
VFFSGKSDRSFKLTAHLHVMLGLRTPEATVVHPVRLDTAEFLSTRRERYLLGYGDAVWLLSYMEGNSWPTISPRKRIDTAVEVPLQEALFAVCREVQEDCHSEDGRDIFL